MAGLMESFSDSPSSAPDTVLITVVKVGLAVRALVTDVVGVVGGVVTAVETVETVEVAAVVNMVRDVVYIAPVVVVVAAETVFASESNGLIWLTDGGL